MQVVHLTFFSLGNRIHGPRPNLPADKRYPVLLQYFSFYHTIIYQTHPTVNFTKTETASYTKQKEKSAQNRKNLQRGTYCLCF